MLDENAKRVPARAVMSTEQANRLRRQGRTRRKTQFLGQGVKMSEPAMFDQNETWHVNT
jgi:hypothetical protein